MKRERRTFHTGIEVRAADNGHINGYAAVFNQEYILWDSPDLRVVERIKPGAFTRSLQAKDDVRCLFNHDANNVLGRTTAGTLSLEQDDHGLKFDNEPPDTQLGRDLRVSIKRKDITGCSFAFIVTKQTRTEEENNGKTTITREIEEVSPVFDVGPVTYPAYEGTDVSARAAELRSAFDGEDIPPAVTEVLRSKPNDEPDGDGDEGDGDDDMQECACRCRACYGGDHEECEQYMETCADPVNCQGMAERSERAAKKAKKTKRVDGEDLEADGFLYVGDPQQPKTWALPWKFSSTDKIKSHLRNALSRFDQTKKIPADKKAEVYKKLVAKCKEYGIHVDGQSEQDSTQDQGDQALDIAAARTRTLLAEAEL